VAAEDLVTDEAGSFGSQEAVPQGAHDLSTALNVTVFLFGRKFHVYITFDAADAAAAGG
jgi:hypothetical protein